MKTSANGRRLIEIWEEGGKAKLTPYDDGTGTLTIGFGHTSAAGPPTVYHGMVITAEQADNILSSDLGKVERDVNKLVRVILNQNQFDALVSFHFNTGALGRSTLLTELNKGHYTAVPSELMKWTHGGGKVMPGLVTRRKAEIKLFNTPVKGMQMVDTPVVTVPVQSIWGSKVFWTQIIGVAASIATVVSGGKINLSPETQASIILTIQSLSSVLTVIFKNFYTVTITPASATKVGG